MNSYDVDALMAVKESFQGNNFQWVKTSDRNKLGKVVRVTDITPGNRGTYFAQLSDGSRLPTDRLTSDLLMLMDDQPALSMDEVLSINYVPGLDGQPEIADSIPAEFRQEIASSPAASPRPPIALTRPTQSDPGDLFGMFSLEDTEIPITVTAKLPTKALLKMMYSNSQNQEDFLNKLSVYINNSVTPESIKSSMQRMLGQDKKKKD